MLCSALIQMMAASVAKRDVCYFTFDDDQLTDQLYKIHDFIKNENGLEVGMYVSYTFRSKWVLLFDCKGLIHTCT